VRFILPKIQRKQSPSIASAAANATGGETCRKERAELALPIFSAAVAHSLPPHKLRSAKPVSNSVANLSFDEKERSDATSGRTHRGEPRVRNRPQGLGPLREAQHAPPAVRFLDAQRAPGPRPPNITVGPRPIPDPNCSAIFEQACCKYRRRAPADALCCYPWRRGGPRAWCVVSRRRKRCRHIAGSDASR
jgi:hypothetical protein